jgi:hypothetical protein
MGLHGAAVAIVSGLIGQQSLQKGIIIMRAFQDRDPQIRKRGNIEDEATLEAFELFDFTTTSGGRRTIQVERARSRDAQHVYRQLLSSNAALSLCEFDAIAAVRQAIENRRPMCCATLSAWAGARVAAGLHSATAVLAAPERSGKSCRRAGPSPTRRAFINVAARSRAGSGRLPGRLAARRG